jgi:hypothetical protein
MSGVAHSFNAKQVHLETLERVRGSQETGHCLDRGRNNSAHVHFQFLERSIIRQYHANQAGPSRIMT